MMNDTNWLLHDHRKYEDMLAECATLLAQPDWEGLRRGLNDLVSLLKGHMLMEEEVLFRAYEQILGTPKTPTERLRKEHNRIRTALRIISAGLDEEDSKSAKQWLSALQEIMTRHHEMEEEIFLPMAGHALLEKRGEVMARLKRHDWKYALRSWGT